MNQNVIDTVIRSEERFEDGNSYSYQLMVRRGDTTADWQIPLYSIRISMTDKSGRERKADAKDVFASEEKAVAFFDKIVRNLATPIDLAYIIEDELNS